MSGRSATPAVLAEWGKNLNTPVHLLEVDFNPTIYLTDGPVALTWNGNEYQPSQLLSFSPIAETSELLVNSVTVGLSGVAQSVISILLDETYVGRTMKIRLAMLDEALAVIPDPVLIFDGQMNRPVINVALDDGTVTCTVEGVSRWADFERRNGRHSNDAEQQFHFPGDKGFAQVSVLPETVFWNISQRIGEGTGATPRKRG